MTKILILFLIFCSQTLYAQNKWNVSFEDVGTSGCWEDSWFLDGKKASVKYTNGGILFKAGNIINDHASHAVMWTREIFSGDVKIEYDFTRKDTLSQDATVIIYIHAEGIGYPPFTKDIYKWREVRVIPFMYIYYWGMNTIHVSYSTSPIGKGNYIRARRYPVRAGSISFEQTEVPPTYSGEGLFKPDVSYHLTFTKTGNHLTFEIKGDGKAKTFEWESDSFSSIQSGRVGFRQMWGRNSLYKNIKISQVLP